MSPRIAKPAACFSPSGPTSISTEQRSTVVRRQPSLPISTD